MQEGKDILCWFLDKTGEIVFSNVDFNPGSIPNLVEGKEKGTGSVFGKAYRYQRFNVDYGVVIVMSHSKELLISSRIFNEKAQLYRDFFSTIVDVKTKIIDDTLHDLTRIHGHNIQEVHNLIPEDLMFRSFEKQIAAIKSEILKNLDDAAIALIQIIRNNRIMNAEFENIRLIHGGEVVKKIQQHKIDSIIQSILYLYDQDFQNKNIKTNNAEDSERINISYNFFVGALIPIFENILKYSKTDTSLKIEYFKEKNIFTIRFKMHSLKFSLEEEIGVLSKNISGELARSTGKAGKGLGMYHAKRLLAMNNASLRLYSLPGAQEEGNYRDNILDIIFEKI